MEFVQQNIMWIAVALVSGGMLLYPMIAGGAGGGISAAEATALINREDGIVVDVRETSEWSAGHIPNARHIALAQLGGKLSELEKFKRRPIIVCCASGNRSNSACRALRNAGFERVFNLAGGIGAWTDAGMPVTTRH
jgi:rhodanese-related sulfurtransferase